MSRVETWLTRLQTASSSSWTYLRDWMANDLPPGPGNFPYLGLEIAQKIQTNTLRTLLDLYDEFGPVFTVRFFGLRMVWMVGPEANAYILLKHHKNFLWRDGQMGDLIPFLGNGLLTTDGETHDRARRLIQPLFRKEYLRQYVVDMVERAQQAVEKLQPNQEVEIYDWSRELTLEVATHLLFGMDTDQELCHELGEYFTQGLAYFGVFYHLQYLKGPGTPWAAMRHARQQLVRILDSEIKRRRTLPERADNILDLLLSAKDGHDQFSDEEILDQVLTLLFAGHDTTTATVSWMFSLLGLHRAVYHRLQEEIDTVLQGEPPSFEQLMHELPYLDKVLAETLRMNPPAWIGPRMAVDDFEFGGFTIPGRTLVVYSSWLTHHLPHVFPEPEVFDPERFTPERIKALPQGAYVPFGWGPRLCVGKMFGELEIKVIVIAFLQKYHVELLPGQIFAAHTMPTIRPKDGVRVWVKPH